MKKYIALLLALCLCLSLAACGGNETPSGGEPSETPSQSTNEPGNEPSSEPQAEKTLTIGLTSDVTPLSCVDPTTETAAAINNIMSPLWSPPPRTMPATWRWSISCWRA